MLLYQLTNTLSIINVRLTSQITLLLSIQTTHNPSSPCMHHTTLHDHILQSVLITQANSFNYTGSLS